MFLLALVVTVGLGVLFIPGALATSPSTSGFFELDKNLTNDLTTDHIGVLKGNVSVGATSIVVCELVTPSGGDTLLIDGEQMTIATVGTASNKTGGCSFSDPNDTPIDVRTYTLTSATTDAHSGSSDVTRLVTGSVPGDDWNQVYAAVQANPTADNPCSALTGSVACDWIHDPLGVSVYTGGGSKDIYDVEGNWMWTDSSVPDADEILDAYAIKYTNSDQYLFFGADRYATNGAKDFGFWFFNNDVAPQPDGSFTGVHQARAPLGCDPSPSATTNLCTQRGDILILGTFTQGGAVTNIRVFEWVASGGSDGPLDLVGAFGDCVPGTSTDSGCNTVNNTTVPSPWPYTGKNAPASDVQYSGANMEGGVDLTDLGLEGCFSSFLAETRSAPSVSAQLKDFVWGKFEACTSSLSTTPADSGGTDLVNHPSDPNNISDLPDVTIGAGANGVDVTDNATLNVGGAPTWSGTLDFYLCGPISTGTCDSGGYLVDSQSIDQTDGTSFTSATVNLTSVGRYCWRGEFTSSTTGVPDSSDHSTGECFEVLPVTPSLATYAWSSGDSSGSAQTDPVDFGNALYDKASLSGTAYKPGTDGTTTAYPSIAATMDTAATGSITFTLKKDDCSTNATGTGDNPESGVSVSGDGDYFSSGFTPDAPGDYSWQASYTGDSPNTTSTSHNGSCDQTNEDVTVRTIPTTIQTQQSWFPNDTANITSTVTGDNLGANGTVDFYLYDSGGCDSGTLLYEEQQTLTGGSNNEEVSTHNYTGSNAVETDGSTTVTPYSVTTAYDDAAGSSATLYWKVVYTPATGDTAHTGKQSACTETHTITYTNDNGPGTDLP